MYKYNCSDLHWIGDEHSHAFNLILRQLQFDPNKVEPSIPKEIPDEVLDQIDKNIESCSTRIRLQEDKDKAEEDIENLKMEAYHLRNPQQTPFHWDLTIYGDNTNTEDSNEENESYDITEFSEQNVSDEQSVDDGRYKRGRSSLDFNVGKKKSSSQIGPIEYNIGDFVILISGLFCIKL
jgi:hypothetical protein